MSRRLFTVPAFTPTATADTAALANGTHMTIGAASAALALMVTELFVQGAGISSANVNGNLFARNSTIGVTPTALAAPASDGPKAGGLSAGPGTAALTYTAAGTAPQRSAVTTAAKLALTINALGGIARWKPADLSEAWWVAGVTVSVSESSLSASTAIGVASGAQSATLEYEPL